MDEMNKDKKKEEEKKAGSEPRLGTDFFSRLSRQPSCKTKGICDNCGRCEH